MNINDLIAGMRAIERCVAKAHSIQAPKPMPKTYQKSKAFRNQKTLRKK